MSRDELAVLDGGKCILQLRGVRPFLSEKYDLTQHPNYKLTADYDPQNTFDIEKYLHPKIKIHPSDAFVVVDTELSGLKTELPDKWEYYIDRLSCHIASTGKQYHSHAATIYKWAQEDAAKGKAAPKQGIPDYSCKEGESL